jgi:hypothetical protein
VIAEISASSFNAFFAWAPWVIGALIYSAFYIAKRNESSAKAPAPSEPTYACAGCGRRGARELMVPQNHGGAVGWYCTNCASSPVATR